MIYLDYITQAPLPDAVKKQMTAALDIAGQPLSPHAGGAAVAEIIEEARNNVASLLGAAPEEIIFTSGGTESNNTAVFGLASANERKGKRIVTSAIEHVSIMDAASRLVRSGWNHDKVAVNSMGIVSLDSLEKAFDSGVAVVCVTAASDENGMIQPISDISAICAKHGAPLHLDATQAAGHIELDFASLGVSSMTISGPPMYAPSGVGALIVKKGTRLPPYIIGGGGEDGRRGGSPNILGIAGIGAAAKLCRDRMSALEQRVASLRDMLIVGVMSAVPDAVLIGDRVGRLPGHVAFIIPRAEGEAMARELDLEGVRVSSGSLCARWALKPSHVLAAMNIPAEHSKNITVFSLGDGNDEKQVKQVVSILPRIVAHVRNLG